ncbi:unnamed protein product [Diplocarpon coronariae]
MEYSYSTFTTTRNFTYSYVHNKPADIRSSYDWRHQTFCFKQKGYGIVVPDLLGYRVTSKPLDVGALSRFALAYDSVVDVSRGSFLLSRLANNFPDLFMNFAFVGAGETIQFVNISAQEAMGFGIWGYLLFFDENAAELMGLNLGKEYMGATGGMRKWLNGKNLAKREEWLEPEVMAYDHRIFARETGGYAAALNWCRAQLHNINAEDEKAIPEANYILDQPVLLIRTDNFISATADMATQMKATALKLEVKKVKGSHWVMLQRKLELNEIMCLFVDH